MTIIETETEREKRLESYRLYASHNKAAIAARKAEYYKNNKEHLRGIMKQNHSENKEARNAQCKEYYHAHKHETVEKDRRRSRLWYQNNKARVMAKASKRLRVREEQRCACCPDSVFISIYAFARLAGLHVDHIRPLSKKGVHCQVNLQLLSPEANLSKAASWDGVSGVGI